MGWVGTSRPGRSLPPGKTRYPLYRRLDGPQGRSGQVRKISPPPGFDPRTVQHVASRYTDWAIAAHINILYYNKLFLLTSLKVATFYKKQRRVQCAGHLVRDWRREIGAEVWWRNVKVTFRKVLVKWILTLTLLMWRICWAPNNASRWKIGFNSAFKGLENQGGLACTDSSGSG